MLFLFSTGPYFDYVHIFYIIIFLFELIWAAVVVTLLLLLLKLLLLVVVMLILLSLILYINIF